MHIDDVEPAALARINKGFQKVQSGGPDPVRDSGSGKASAAASERHHVLLVDLGGFLGAQIGLAGIVWLIGPVKK